MVGGRAFTWNRHAAAVLVLGAALLFIAMAAAPSAGAHSRRPRPHRDGLGIQPRKDQARLADHPREQVLRRDVHRAEPQHLPVADAAVSRASCSRTTSAPATSASTTTSRWSAARRRMADTQVDCPYYDHFSGHVDRSGSLRHNPNYGQMTSAQGPNAAAGANGCVYPASVKTLFNQFDCRRRELEGLRPGPRATPTRRRLQHSAGVAVLRRPIPLSRPDRQQGAAQPERRQRDQPVPAQALPVPVVRVDTAVGPSATPSAHRRPVRLDARGCFTTSSA